MEKGESMNENSEYWLMFGRMMDACNQFWGNHQTPGIIKKCAEIALECIHAAETSITKEQVSDIDPRKFAVDFMKSPAFNELKTSKRAKPAGGGDSLTDRIEAAYMGEHMNIQPDEPTVDKKPLTKSEQRFYDYYVAHPGASKREIERELGISQSMYFFLKCKCRKKGWISKNGEIVGLEIKEN